MTSRLRRSTGLLLMTTVLAIGAVAPTAAASPAGPTRKMALGVSMLPFSNMQTLDDFTVASGRTPAIWSVWSSWGSSHPDFPTELAGQLKQRGVVPLFIWEPVNPQNQTSSKFSYRRIILGQHDDYIRAWALAAKAHGGRVLLRFAHEMNGTWFPWSTNRFDNSPKRFRLAWQHIWNIFRGPRGVGATNVKFVWSPNQPCGNCATMASVFPGKTYVDYAAFSSFNWSTPQKWKSMVKTFDLSMKTITAITGKRVIVAETASSPEGGNKAAWIAQGYPAVYAKWPRIKAIVYFNVNTLDVNQRDWRLVTPKDAPLRAYKAILTDPRFQGTIN